VDLIDPSSLYLSAPMDEVDAGLLRRGLVAKLTVDSRPDEEFPGSLGRVAPYVMDIEAQNRTVEIEAEFDDPVLAASFLPGTSADVEVVLEKRDEVIRISTSSLLEGGRVLVVEDGVLVERQVELGLRNWEYAEVLSGLSEGERVVMSLDRVEIKAGAKAVAIDSASDPHS
jgi:HlyD family secretion protein